MKDISQSIENDPFTDLQDLLSKLLNEARVKYGLTFEQISKKLNGVKVSGVINLSSDLLRQYSSKKKNVGFDRVVQIAKSFTKCGITGDISKLILTRDQQIKEGIALLKSIGFHGFDKEYLKGKAKDEKVRKRLIQRNKNKMRDAIFELCKLDIGKTDIVLLALSFVASISLQGESLKLNYDPTLEVWLNEQLL